MKRTALLLTAAGIVAAFALAAFASAPKPLAVTVADIEAAGYTNVKPIAPTPGRWAAPTSYFTSDAEIPSADAKRDCADCGKVIAAYAAVTESVPGWSINQREFVRKVAGRWQGRAFVAKTKTVIVVMGPDEKLVGMLLQQLQKKFGA